MTVRALVVDDSPTMRAMISTLLGNDPEIEVVGTASNTATARTMMKELDPDVVTLDIEMPGMNGIEFLDKIMRLRPTPVVMVSTLTHKGAEITVRALELGAFDCYAKPIGSFREASVRDGGKLTSLVKDAAATRRKMAGRTAPAAPTAASGPPANYRPRPGSMIAIGASTGGVEALVQVISQWPANCPPTVIVQHMPPVFTTSFAARLDRLSGATVTEATHGAPLLPGHVYLAPGGEKHLELVGGGTSITCRLIADDPTSGHRPSVDRMFQSVAKVVGKNAVGAILTGMGADGARGLKQMRDTGCFTVGQDEATCVVYGMPGVAKQLDAVEVQLPLPRIAARLLQACAL